MGSITMMKELGKLVLGEKTNKIGVIFLKERRRNVTLALQRAQEAGGSCCLSVCRFQVRVVSFSLSLEWLSYFCS